MKRVLLLATAAVLFASPALALQHRTPLPIPLPIPVPSPHPAPVLPTMGSVLKNVAANSNVIIADLQAANAVASAINPNTGKPYDALGAMCFPAAIGLIQNLPNPANFPQPGTGAGLITGLEEAYLTAQAAQATINQFVTSGLPQNFKEACDPWIMDNMAQATQAVGMFTAFFAALVPK